MKKVILSCLLFLFISGCSLFDSIPNKPDTDTINSANNAADEINAKAIINQVEYAYTTASINSTSYPTLNQVKNSFSMTSAKWDNNKIITQNFECDIQTKNNNLKVKCLDIETTMEMILSSN